MVDSGGGGYLVLELVFVPGEGASQDVEQPDIVLCFIARVAPEDYQVRLTEEHGVTVALAWSVGFVGDFDDFPNWSAWCEAYYLRRSRM